MKLLFFCAVLSFARSHPVSNFTFVENNLWTAQFSRDCNLAQSQRIESPGLECGRVSMSKVDGLQCRSTIFVLEIANFSANAFEQFDGNNTSGDCASGNVSFAIDPSNGCLTSWTTARWVGDQFTCVEPDFSTTPAPASTTTRAPTCAPGFAGDDCSQCDKGRFGSECRPCLCVRGTCNDGIGGNGECSACRHPTLRLPLCDACVEPSTQFGTDCQACLCEAANGVCDSGFEGSGACKTCTSERTYGELCQHSCDDGGQLPCEERTSGRHTSVCSAGVDGLGCTVQSGDWLHDNDVGPDPLLALYLIGCVGFALIGFAVAYKRYPDTVSEVIARPRGAKGWLTSPIVLSIVVVLCQAYHLMLTVLAVSSFKRNRRDADDIPTVLFFASVFYPAVMLLGTGVKVYLLMAGTALERSGGKYVDADKGEQPFYRGGGPFQWTREARLLFLLKLVFLLIVFLSIGVAPLAKVLEFDLFALRLFGDEATFDEIVGTASYSEELLITFGTIALVIAIGACVLMFAGSSKDDKKQEDEEDSSIMKCCCTLQMCNFVACLLAFVVVGFIVTAKQYDIISTLLELDFEFSDTFWLTFGLSHAFILLDVVVSILALTGQVGKYASHAQASMHSARDAEDGRVSQASQASLNYAVEKTEEKAEEKIEEEREERRKQ